MSVIVFKYYMLPAIIIPLPSTTRAPHSPFTCTSDLHTPEAAREPTASPNHLMCNRPHPYTPKIQGKMDNQLRHLCLQSKLPGLGYQAFGIQAIHILTGINMIPAMINNSPSRVLKPHLHQIIIGISEDKENEETWLHPHYLLLDSYSCFNPTDVGLNLKINNIVHFPSPLNVINGYS